MKTKTTYPMNVKRAITLLIAGLFLVQVQLTASDSSRANQKYSKAEYACSNINAEAFEEEMEIEDWMCDPQHAFWSDLQVAAEEEMEIEDWMCDIHHSFWTDINVTEEEEMAIESWMANPKDWKFNDNKLMLCQNQY